MNKYVDLIDELNCSDTCEAVLALCELVDLLIKDQQYLELQCIGLRYELSKYLPSDQQEVLRSDILSALGSRHSGNSAYELYKALFYGGGDPMEFHEWLQKVSLAINGHGEIWF